MPISRYPVMLTAASKFARGERGYVVSFPDVPEARTQGHTTDEAMANAVDCLCAALGGYVELRRALPTPSRPKRGQRAIPLPPLVAAKLGLYRAMRQTGISRVALGRKLGVSEGAVRRLLNLDHRSHIGQVNAALVLLGKRLVVEVDDAA